MKSKTSLFNKGLSKNLFKRFWPLWAAFLLLLIFMLPVRQFNSHQEYLQVVSRMGDADYYNPGQIVLDSASDMIMLSFFAAPAVAMAVFGDLYKSRSCSMLSSLPLKRECVFITAFLTGLLPMLLAELLIFAFSLLMGWAESYYLLLWLAAALMSSTAFFGYASLCAMLTGNIVILPAVYFVLNLTPLVVEECVSGILGKIVYGFMEEGTGYLLLLSPAAAMGAGFYSYVDPSGALIHEGLGMVALYCLAGIGMAAAALLLFKRRNMECAGDVVAVKCLKPIFKYCMSFGTALVLGNIVSSAVDESLFEGFGGSVLILLLMLAGAVIGYYAAEMMMQKSLRVFGSKWKGLIPVALVLAAFVLGFETDVFGYEKRIPQAGDVEYASISGIEVRNRDYIEKLIELHGDYIAAKDSTPAYQDREFVVLRYKLNNGGHISRQYRLERSEQSANDPQSPLYRSYEFYNLPENILNAHRPQIPVAEENIKSCRISCSSCSEDGMYTEDSVQLSPAQAFLFYEQCILPDILDGNLGLRYPYRNSAAMEEETNVWISIDLAEGLYDGSGAYRETGWDGIYLTLLFRSERCMDYLKENTDFQIMSQREAEELSLRAQGLPAAAAESPTKQP